VNPTSVDVKDMIEDDSSLGLVHEISLYVSKMPDQPNLCVATYDAPGEPPDSHVDYWRPHVQVRVRGRADDYTGGHELAQDIQDSLNGRHNETWNSTRYIGIWVESPVSYVNRDERNRPLFVMTFRINRTTT